MRLQLALLPLLATPVKAAPLDIFDAGAAALTAVEQWFGPHDELVDPDRAHLLVADGDEEAVVHELTVSQGFSDYHGAMAGICTLRARGGGADDTDNFVNTMKRCGKNSVIFMNSPVYNIRRPVKIRLENSVLSLSGWLKFSDDIEYWVQHAFDLGFQNQKLAMVVSGSNFVLNGEDTGGIDGSGQAWYDYARGVGNVHGRPMSLALIGARNAVVTNWGIRQPQFWAHIAVDSDNVVYESCYVNATSTSGSFEEKSWLQNTDGIDTYRTNDVVISNFVYQGGDDCIAFKPNSTNIVVQNVTCVGGTGIAFGSIAQYDGVKDLIENVVLKDIKLYPSDQCRGYQGVYFKSWIGEEVGHPPNGGGGGYGYCRNVSVEDVYMEDIDRPLALTAGLTYLDDEHGKHKYGMFEWSHINITRVRATSTGNRAIWLDCSPTQPCHHIRLKDVVVTPGKSDHPEIHQVCNFVMHSEGDGLEGCKPNNSTLESDTGGTM
ncbi:hypothetical protein CspeluHIS016_0309990 [Cutaneotrichosporon spelunceum]|uniref:galacturonan 1,4-alpha-galacturonidase n=1 Tax=Cutaneotrichosporon spelunceum TaxID=1672016 RepID=A0AAD3YCS5_9TREE|nr:hypothetical protein CspeluHIS016_0309990 [Cutaneotrichosporon spelunceum]